VAGTIAANGAILLTITPLAVELRAESKALAELSTPPSRREKALAALNSTIQKRKSAGTIRKRRWNPVHKAVCRPQ
jgi:hypothetical protein